MKKFVSAIALVASLLPVVASAAPNDGYTFDRKQIDRETYTVEMVYLDSRAEVQDAYVKAFPKGFVDRKTLNAFTEVNTKEAKCKITMVAPWKRLDPSTLGHEMMHCQYANWHKGN